MKVFFFAVFCITLAHAQYPGQPGGRPPPPPGKPLGKPPGKPPGKRFRDPLEVKKIIIGCDLDKSGELSTDEVAKCGHEDTKALDINGDGRVERHEIKQAVKLSQPDMEKEREKYLDEIAKFKDMVRDCDVDKTDSNGEITNEEGLQCLQQFPKHKEVFEDIDENKDGNLVKEELRNHVSRVRAKNYVADGHHRRQPHGPTTPMN